MNRLIYVFIIVMICFGAAASQDRPRYFDNFDTTSGVRVHYPPSPVVVVSSAPRTTADRTRVPQDRSYLPSPPTGEKYRDWVATSPSVTTPRVPAPSRKTIVVGNKVNKTALVTVGVEDGYAQRNPTPQYDKAKFVMSSNSYLRGYSTGDSTIDSFIVDSSRRYNIDPLLIISQMNQESSFKERATSPKGASGLMQLMPATARRMGVTDIYDPQQNIEGGVKYMRFLLDLFSGDIDLALAGYNAGEGAVIKYGYQIPPYNETQDYVRRISSRYRSISTVNMASYSHSGAGSSGKRMVTR